jgi:hypothetical protein
VTLASNEEFESALGELIGRWCDERQLQPRARLLPGYLAFNGLTDGWTGLRSGLLSVRSLGADEFDERDWATLDELIRAANEALDHR